MVFSSVLFLFLFLGVVLAVYYLLPRKMRNLWLFVTSLLFYGYGEPVFLFLMIGSITWNYVCGRLIEDFSGGRRKAALIICVAGNLLALGYFKYTGLLLDTLRNLPIFAFLPYPEIALPIGISFYTFQAMSYVVDVYWGNCPAQKNYITFGTYVALFPQLIAGPIVRFVDVQHQLQTRRETPEMFNRGAKLFLVGLAKKVLLANPLGALWGVLRVTDGGIVGAWVGVLAFTLQIYFDFSGYSDMARGLGNMLGFSFVKNFNYPYISRSITEFWRRWHISLGTWFREYVYIPLGGNRRGKARQCLNLFIVWGLTGLWHGASWNFVVWGLMFGVLLTIEKFFLLKPLQKGPKIIGFIYTMLFVMLGWVVFDFTNTGEMFAYLGRLFNVSQGFIGQAAYPVLTHLPILAIGIFACLPVGRKLYDRVAMTRSAWLWEALGAAVILLLCTAALVSSTYNPFLYFRF